MERESVISGAGIVAAGNMRGKSANHPFESRGGENSFRQKLEKGVKVAGLFLLGGILAACGDSSDADHKVLRVGMPPSAHNILVEKVVKPELEAKGYEVVFRNFGALRDANSALVEGGIDFHTAQHQAYLDVYNRETGADLVSVVHTPSIPAFIYSTRQKSLDTVEEGASILVPNDPSNAARSYALLQKIGWIELDPQVDLAIVTARDITKNNKNLQFTEVDSALIPRLLEEIDYGVMPGGVALLGGIGPEYALAHETFLPDLELMVTVRKEDQNAPWIDDLKAAFKSDKMRHFIETDPEIAGWFIWPEG